MARKAAEESKGNVVCVEKGDKLAHELPNAVRLVNSEEYDIRGFANLYGFLAGFLAGNYDITHLFVDGTFKIGKVGDVEKDYEGFAAMIQKLAKVQSDAQIIFTVSCDEADLPDHGRLRARLDAPGSGLLCHAAASGDGPASGHPGRKD